MAHFRINLFGRFAIFIDQRPLALTRVQTKPIELLAYLLLFRRHPHGREVIAALLWPDLTPTQARRNLRKVLCTLQQLLTDSHRANDPPLVLIDHEWLAINPICDLQLDVAIFEQAYVAAQQRTSADLSPHMVSTLTAAVELYSGELLTGFYADWCLQERERLENMYLELRRVLLLVLEQQQAYDQAIIHGLEILRHDRANERTYRDLMRLYYLSGNRSMAIHQYEHCVAALRKELGVSPSKVTTQLYQHLCSDDLDAAEHSDGDAARAAAVSGERPQQQHLLKMRTELQQMLQQVQEELQHVERMLNGSES